MEIGRIEKILKDHLNWFKSGGKEGQKAFILIDDFHKLDLRNSFLSKAVLAKSYFSEANLSNSDLSYADLERTNFRSSNLSGANLVGSNLFKANLIDSDLSEANLSKCDLSGADLRGAKLKGAILTSSVLCGSNLSDTNFESADLSNSDISKATLDNTIFLNTNLFGVNFTNSKMISLDLNGANTSEANFSKVKIDPKTIRQLDEHIINKYGDKFTIFGLFENFPSIVRFIEFPPEYFLAGVSTLHAFGNVLKSKYPEKKSRLRIEQDGNKVTMIIQTNEGDKEIIESELHEYGLVISGKKPIEQFTRDPYLALQIKTELIYAKARIEAQKETLLIQQAEIDTLNKIILNSFKQPFYINVNQTVNLEIDSKFRLVFGILNELKEKIEVDSDEYKIISELQESLDTIKTINQKNEIAESSAMSKMFRFIKQIGDEKTNLGKTIKGIHNSFQIVKDLTAFYNEIAKWCGLPGI